MNTKKAIIIVVAVALGTFVAGTIAYSAFGIGNYLEAGTFLNRLIGTSPGNFGMKLSLVGVLGTVFLVPSIRGEFTGSFSAGADYKRSKKKGSGRI